MQTQRLFDALENGIQRIQRAIRILEDDLHLASKVKELLAVERGGICAFIKDAAGGGLKQVKHHISDRRLARTGLTNQRQGRAAAQVKGDIIDGLKLLLFPAGVPNGEFLG